MAYMATVKKSKGHRRTCHESKQGEQRYGSTLSVTSALDGVGGQRHAPAALPLGKTWYPLYRRLGKSQGRCGRVRKIRPHQDSIPGPSSPQRVAIPTELPRPIKWQQYPKKKSAFYKFSLPAESEYTFLEHKDDTYFKMVGCWERGGIIRQCCRCWINWPAKDCQFTHTGDHSTPKPCYCNIPYLHTHYTNPF